MEVPLKPERRLLALVLLVLATLAIVFVAGLVVGGKWMFDRIRAVTFDVYREHFDDEDEDEDDDD